MKIDTSLRQKQKISSFSSTSHYNVRKNEKSEDIDFLPCARRERMNLSYAFPSSFFLLPDSHSPHFWLLFQHLSNIWVEVKLNREMRENYLNVKNKKLFFNIVLLHA